MKSTIEQRTQTVMTYIDAYNILYRLYRQPDEYRTEAKQDDKQPNSIIIFI